MTEQTVVSYNIAGLEQLQKELGKQYYTRVGILGAKAARSDESKEGLNNAMLGLIMIFGSLSKKIPPRDFLITPIVQNNKRLLEALASGKMMKKIESGDFKGCFKLLGVIAETFIHEAFQTSGDGQWPPNKPSTIKRKGSDKPLIDTRQLERSIASDVVES